MSSKGRPTLDRTTVECILHEIDNASTWLGHLSKDKDVTSSTRISARIYSDNLDHAAVSLRPELQVQVEAEYL